MQCMSAILANQIMVSQRVCSVLGKKAEVNSFLLDFLVAPRLSLNRLGVYKNGGSLFLQYESGMSTESRRPDSSLQPWPLDLAEIMLEGFWEVSVENEL